MVERLQVSNIFCGMLNFFLGYGVHLVRGLDGCMTDWNDCSSRLYYLDTSLYL